MELPKLSGETKYVYLSAYITFNALYIMHDMCVIWHTAGTLMMLSKQPAMRPTTQWKEDKEKEMLHMKCCLIHSVYLPPPLTPPRPLLETLYA